MPDSLTVRRVLGDRPFAETGTPSAVALSRERGIAVVAGDLGHLKWPGDSAAGYGWRPYRVGVYGTDDLRCRRLVESRWPVHSLAVHPTLPLVAVGTGDFDPDMAFEGELLLIDLESGRSRSMMRTPREVLRVEWESPRALRLKVAPTYEDNVDEPEAQAYDVLVERPDWGAAPRGSVQQKELRGPLVAFERTRADGAAVEAVAELSGRPWQPRRQVWDVRGLPDGRVLACLDRVLAEAWLPDGRLDWRVADAEGGRQLIVRPLDAWVNVPRRATRPPGGDPGTEAPFVARLSLADGTTLGTLPLDSTVTIATRRDGWLALRPAGPGTRYDPRPVALVPPGNEAPQHSVNLGGFAPGNHTLPVRHSSRLLFLQGKETEPVPHTWVVEVDPDGSAPRHLFPLDWRTPARHLLGGPGIELGPPDGPDLVHAGTTYTPGPAFGAFVVRRSLAGGAVRWEFTADCPATAMDGDEDTVYVAFNSGEVVALDASDGTVRRRHRPTVGGLPVVPLSVQLAGPDRLLLGTVDGRVLDCSVER
ncbi:PQQ-binding-like beta-propeller repeat protein [Streptomyces sp. NPDC001606]